MTRLPQQMMVGMMLRLLLMSKTAQSTNKYSNQRAGSVRLELCGNAHSNKRRTIRWFIITAKSPPQQVDPFPAPYDDGMSTPPYQISVLIPPTCLSSVWSYIADSSVTKLAKELTAASVMPDPAIMRPMKDSPAPAGQAPTHLPSQSNHSNPSNRNLDKPFIEPSDFMPVSTLCYLVPVSLHRVM